MLTKIFERTWVIRLFGIALIFAPFFNTFYSVSSLPDIPSQHKIFYLWQFARSAPVAQQVLQFASLIIGALMLSGSVTAWKYTLGLLGVYIVMQFMDLSNGASDKWTWFFLFSNVGLFFFIADQLVLKPRPVSAKAPVQSKSTPFPAHEVKVATSPTPVEAKRVVSIAKPQAHPQVRKQSSNKIYIEFQDVGRWAFLTDVSQAGVSLRSIATPPQGIEQKTLELALSPELTLKLRFKSAVGSDYSFDYVDISKDHVRSLNHWLVSQATVKSAA